MKVFIDYRERPSGIVKHLAKAGLDVEVKALALADFILKTKSRDGNLLTVGIEKKTQDDFLNSIADKRLIKQLIDLKEQFSSPLLIIEGDSNIYTLRNFHPNAIRGMLAAISIDLQVPIVHTRNVRDTASFISTIAKRLEKPHHDISLNHKRRAVTLEDKQEVIIESLPGVGPKLAKNLLKHFGSVIDVLTASEEELQKVEKIGKKKAEEIRNIVFEGYKS